MALITRPAAAAQPAPAAAPAAGVAKVQLNVLVTPALKRALKQRAMDDDTTVNALIERVMREYLER